MTEASRGRASTLAKPPVLSEILMLTGIERSCPDCRRPSVFIVVDDGDGGIGEFCCTACGAAILIDPAFDDVRLVAHVA